MNAQHIARVWVSNAPFGSLDELVAQKVLYLVSEEYTDDQIYVHLIDLIQRSLAPESVKKVYREFITQYLEERKRERENA